MSLKLRLFAAFGADAFDHVVDGMWSEPVRNINNRYSCSFQTICFLAELAMEMGVLVSDGVMRVTMAQFIF